MFGMLDKHRVQELHVRDDAVSRLKACITTQNSTQFKLPCNCVDNNRIPFAQLQNRYGDMGDEA